MEQIWKSIQNSLQNSLQNIDYSGFTIVILKIVAVIVILTFTQILRKFFATVIIKRIEKLVSKSKTSLDDDLVAILKPSISLLILFGGLWLAKVIVQEDLSPQVTNALDGFINIITIFIVAYVFYRASSLLAQIIANYILRTDTELDHLLKPFLPKIFQAITIIVLALKISELFLGQSAAALVGLLGGAGLTLGLLFKDLLYDWFCTVVIYSDAIYKEGDSLVITGFQNMVNVLSIGFRTTTLHDPVWGSITKMPNSKMISGIVANWSQNASEEGKCGINLHLQIDGISAQQTSRVCEGIEKLPALVEGCYEKCLVRFKKIEQNARVIEIRAYVPSLKFYFAAERKLNLAILELLEKEGIDSLYVKLETDPVRNKQQQQSANN